MQGAGRRGHLSAPQHAGLAYTAASHPCNSRWICGTGSDDESQPVIFELHSWPDYRRHDPDADPYWGRPQCFLQSDQMIARFKTCLDFALNPPNVRTYMPETMRLYSGLLMLKPSATYAEATKAFLHPQDPQNDRRTRTFLIDVLRQTMSEFPTTLEADSQSLVRSMTGYRDPTLPPYDWATTFNRRLWMAQWVRLLEKKAMHVHIAQLEHEVRRHGLQRASSHTRCPNSSAGPARTAIAAALARPARPAVVTVSPSG